jgi:hypothetical protein
MCQRSPFDLWIGCGNIQDELLYKIPPDEKSKYIPDANQVIRTCFVAAEAPFFKRLFSARTKTREFSQVQGRREF